MWIAPYIYELKEILKQLGITYEQLIAVAMLVGTDFNQGVYGIGQKKALKIAKEHKSIEKIFDSAGLKDWKPVYNLIKNMPVTTNYKLRWRAPDKERVIEFLCKEHDFNEERVKSAVERIQ